MSNKKNCKYPEEFLAEIDKRSAMDKKDFFITISAEYDGKDIAKKRAGEDSEYYKATFEFEKNPKTSVNYQVRMCLENKEELDQWKDEELHNFAEKLQKDYAISAEKQGDKLLVHSNKAKLYKKLDIE